MTTTIRFKEGEATITFIGNEISIKASTRRVKKKAMVLIRKGAWRFYINLKKTDKGYRIRDKDIPDVRKKLIPYLREQNG